MNEKKIKCKFCGAEAVEINGVLTLPCSCADEDFQNSLELEDLAYGKGW